MTVSLIWFTLAIILHIRYLLVQVKGFHINIITYIDIQMNIKVEFDIWTQIRLITRILRNSPLRGTFGDDSRAIYCIFLRAGSYGCRSSLLINFFTNTASNISHQPKYFVKLLVEPICKKTSAMRCSTQN